MEGLSSLLCVILGDRCQNMWFVLHNLCLIANRGVWLQKMFVAGDHWPRKNDDRHQISRFVDARFGNRGCKSCKIKRCGLSCGFHICDIKIFELQSFELIFTKQKQCHAKDMNRCFLSCGFQIWKLTCNCGKKNIVVGLWQRWRHSQQ